MTPDVGEETSRFVHLSSAGVTRPGRPDLDVEAEPPAVRQKVAASWAELAKPEHLVQYCSDLQIHVTVSTVQRELGFTFTGTYKRVYLAL